METKSFTLRFFIKETAARFVALCGELDIDVDFYKESDIPGDDITPESVLDIYVVTTKPISPERKRELISQWAEIIREDNNGQ